MLIALSLSAIALLIMFLLYWKFYFLRDPIRAIPADENLVVSPADGRVSRIIRFGGKKLEIDKGLLGRIKTMTNDVAKKGYLINIVMTPLDVHYQRSPISGQVVNINYKKGKFRNAMLDSKSLRCLRNENNQILIKGKIKAKVIQIAGVLARRIKCHVRKKDNLLKGQRLGLINLGSQVCLIIPEIKKLNIKEGQYVYGGTTVVGEIK